MQAHYTRIRIFLNPQLFLSGYSFRPRASGDSGIRICNLLNPLFRVEMFQYATNPESCGPLIRISSLFGDVTRSSPVLYPEYCIQDGNLDACSVANIPRGVQGTRMNPDPCRYVCTGKFDLNTDTFGRGNFWIRKKKLRTQKYPDTNGRGHRIAYANDELWNSQG